MKWLSISLKVHHQANRIIYLLHKPRGLDRAGHSTPAKTCSVKCKYPKCTDISFLGSMATNSDFEKESLLSDWVLNLTRPRTATSPRFLFLTICRKEIGWLILTGLISVRVLIRQTWVWILEPSLSSWMTLGALLNLSVSHFRYLWHRDDNP